MKKYSLRDCNLIALAGLGAWLLASCGESTADHSTGIKAEKRDLVQQVNVQGRIRSKRSSYIFSGYDGYLGALHVELGDTVKKGQALARVIQSPGQNIKSVYPLRAPHSGVVTQVILQEGQVVRSTTNELNLALLRIDDLSSMWVDVMLPEVDISKLKVGQEAKVVPNALSSSEYTGIVREIALSAKETDSSWDSAKVEFSVRIQLTDSDEKIRPGMSAAVDIVTAKAEGVLALPHEYLYRDGREFYVVDSEGKEHDVVVGLSNESFVEVKEGITEKVEVTMVDFTKIGEPRKKKGSSSAAAR